MAESEPTNLDSKPKPRPRKPQNGTVSPIKKVAAAKKPEDKGVVVEKVKPDEPVKEPKLAKPKVLRDPEHPYYTRKGYAPTAGCQLYEATGGSGQISVRSYAFVPVVAVDKSDPEAPRLADRQGCIYHMYPSNEDAEKVAKKLQEQGYVGRIVEVQPYRGQPGDKK